MKVLVIGATGMRSPVDRRLRFRYLLLQCMV